MNKKRFSTKDEILNYLKKDGPISVADLAKNLGITEMAIRRHLNNLDRDDMIKVTVERQPMGRPTNLYSLTEKAEDWFPKAYKYYLQKILKMVTAERGDDAVEKLFLRIAHEKTAEHKKNLSSLPSLRKKIDHYIEFETYDSNLVKIDENKDSIKITRYNCPMIEIVKENPSLCKCEKVFLQNLFDVDVEILQSIEKGDSCCEFLFKKPDDEL